MNKKIMIYGCLICCFLAFVIPFAFSNNKDSNISILSTSFTALGAIATLITLYIALLLYQRFGIDSLFVGRQVDTTLKLVDLLRNKKINIVTNKFTYYLKFTIDLKQLQNEDFYIYMKSKTIIIQSSDFENFVKPILKIKNNYWLPNEIKEKMIFLEYYGYNIKGKIEDPKKEIYARLYFKFNDQENYVMPFPESTVEEFIINKNLLLLTIEKWLHKHTVVKIDFIHNESSIKINKQ